MRYRIGTMLALVAACMIIAPMAHATEPGQKAYRAAKAFAQEHNLQYFKVRGNRGVKRIVVNVTEAKWDAWTRVFSDRKGYIEPNFSASANSKPGWSYCRIGGQHHSDYSTGSTSRFGYNKVHFPMQVGQDQVRSIKQFITTSPNGSFSFNGGDPHTNGRNCTNWITNVISRFTGVGGAAVDSHFGILLNGRHSNRMTVVGITSGQPIQNFSAENNYFIKWASDYFRAPSPQYHQAL